MNKTYCDICCKEIKADTLGSNKYWVKIKPYTLINDDIKQINEEFKEICYKCASNIAYCIYSMSNRIR